jgi:hypothetical protein
MEEALLGSRRIHDGAEQRPKADCEATGWSGVTHRENAVAPGIVRSRRPAARSATSDTVWVSNVASYPAGFGAAEPDGANRIRAFAAAAATLRRRTP